MQILIYEVRCREYVSPPRLRKRDQPNALSLLKTSIDWFGVSQKLYV